MFLWTPFSLLMPQLLIFHLSNLYLVIFHHFYISAVSGKSFLYFLRVQQCKVFQTKITEISFIIRRTVNKFLLYCKTWILSETLLLLLAYSLIVILCVLGYPVTYVCYWPLRHFFEHPRFLLPLDLYSVNIVRILFFSILSIWFST